MNKPQFLLTSLLCAGATTLHAAQPNIILFLVDDMGWMDCGAYGSRYYETPNIDRFAKQAMRFTQAYAQPLCSPTRACLLTGQSAARHGITTPACHTPPKPHPAPPASRNYLDPEQYTLAECLRDAGWQTGHFGKWHLGLMPQHWPEAQGFGVAFHAQPSAGPPSYFSPYGVSPDGTPGGQHPVGTITDGPPGEYITDRLTDEAIKFIAANKDRPFFVNLWHHGVHGPWGHKEEYTKEFAKKTDPSGMQGNPIMASMLRSIDESLGRILDELDRLGIASNTIVIFNSDNGGNVHSNLPDDRREKAAEKNPELAAQLADWRKWAGEKPPTSNAPLRDGKGTLYEGGERVPLIVRWPGKVPAGTTSDAMVGCMDLYPTLLDVLGLPKPAQQKFDGTSYAAVLRNPGVSLPLRPYFIQAQNGISVHYGDWKLIRPYGPDDAKRELYNLREDPSETKDLAATQPDKLGELTALMDAHLAETGATPKARPAKKTKQE
jgi:arylsulfatase A-like enzyme